MIVSFTEEEKKLLTDADIDIPDHDDLTEKEAYALMDRLYERQYFFDHAPKTQLNPRYYSIQYARLGNKIQEIINNA